ncbi:MAG TPA: carboxypeptidase regulatory-like domain-containing protein [Aridibacter sp.]|nr:carboxypeptidase regulatory-like domain-containing protein [Aridibacter sp.]
MGQTLPISGRVQLKAADGTLTPVENAKVDCYRTDADLGCRSTTTGKDGTFTILGIPLNGTVALAVSAPGVNPTVYPGVKPGQENIEIHVAAGDGSVIDQAETRSLAAQWETNPTGELTEEQKEAQEELERKIKEIDEKNKKIEEKNALIERVLKEGKAAYESGDYTTAAAKFEEGYQADPDFAGSAPLLLNEKARALKKRAVDGYNAGANSGDPAKLSAAKKSAGEDFSAALATYAKALEIASQPGAAEIRTPQNLKVDKFNSSEGGRDAVRLMVLTKTVDPERFAEAKKVIGQFLEIESNKEKQAQAQSSLASYLLEGYDYEGAVIEFRKAYEMSPKDPEILGKFGLALYTLSEVNQDTSMKQESLNFMEVYLSTAPKDHDLRDGIDGAVQAMKSEGLKPQKIN